MKSIFLSKSRVKPKYSQKESLNDMSTSKSPFLISHADKKSKNINAKRGSCKETGLFKKEEGRFAKDGERPWESAPSTKFVSSHAFAGRSSEYSLPFNDLKKKSGSSHSAPNPTGELPSGSNINSYRTQTDSNSKHWDSSRKREQPGSWFGQTLNYVFEFENQDRNELKVLALGVHQYIDDIYDALDANKKGFVHYTDFEILCKLIGKELKITDTAENCLSELCTNQACSVHVHYCEFKQRLLSLFDSNNPPNISEHRNNDKLIETVAKVTRRISSLKYIAKLLEEVEKQIESKSRAEKTHYLLGLDKSRNQREEKIYTENLDLQQQVLLQLQELQCLREIVEDFRIALQTSDAENLALRVKEATNRDKPCKRCCLERNTLKQMSFPNENDSIDRLIINFPSSEALQPPESNLKYVPAEGLTEYPSLGDFGIQAQFRSLLDRSYEDLDLQYELEDIYRELFETKEKLAEMKASLESTDRIKNQEIIDVKSKVIQIAKEATEEKKSLESKIQYGKKQLEEMMEENRAVKEEFESTKAKCETMTNELEELKWNMKRTKKTRRQELKHFKDLRKLLAETVNQTRNLEIQQNDFHHSQLVAFEHHEGSKEEYDGDPVDFPRGSHLVTISDHATKLQIADDFHNHHRLDVDNDRCYKYTYRKKVARQPLNNEVEGSSSSVEAEIQNTRFHTSTTDESKDANYSFDNKMTHRKRIRKKDSQLAKTLPSTDLKPILEVKPNVIKPCVSNDEQIFLKADGEIVRENYKESFNCRSPNINELDFAKVSAELCKEISETFSILNGTMDSYGSSSSIASDGSSGRYVIHGSVESGEKNTQFTDNKKLKLRKRTFSMNNNDDQRNYSYIPYKSENIRTEFYFEDSVCDPMKPVSRSSTQILESLEFEVDLLRKSLEDEVPWR